MDNNEDEPDDVRKATPVEDAISDGRRDEENKIKGSKPKSAPTTSLNDPQEHRKKRCNLFRGKLPPSHIKTKKPCHPKADIICRDNLSKDEYIEVLSMPKKNNGLSCKEKVSLSQRLEELSKPKTSHVVNLLETWGSRLRPEIIDAVKNSLEKNCTMSPEQMEAYYSEKRAEDCGRVRRVRRKKCPAGKEKKKEICDDGLDPMAVCEEYEMAQRFMRHIISHLKNSPFASEDRYDLTEVILSQLGSVLDYRPFGDGDRKFQMMFMLANGIACWVHSLNLAVAEKIAKQAAKDAQEAIETEESEDEEVEEEQNDLTEPTEEDEDKDEDGDEIEVTEEVEETVVEDDKEDEEEREELEEMESELIGDEIPPETEDDNTLEAEVEEEEEETVDTDVDVKIEPEEVVEETEEESVEPAGDVTEDEEPPLEVTEIDEEVDNEGEAEEVEAHEEVEDMEYIEDVETEGKESIVSIAETLIEPGLAIQGLGEGDLFASEIPFVTFGKIMEIVVKFLDKYEEAETSEVRRRLQNAVLNKLTNLVLAEAPDTLDNSMKAVLEVLAENIAVFMEDTLPKSKVNDIETMAPEIESTEVRNWGHWLETVMDNATNWGKWIHEKVGEAEEKAGTKVTRGDWQDWTNGFNSEAIRWRMFNLDTKHQMHHADLNLTHKKVIHRNRRGISAKLAPYHEEKDETEINAYDFADEAEIHDKKSDLIEFGEVEN